MLCYSLLTTVALDGELLLVKSNNTIGCQPSSHRLHDEGASFNDSFHMGWFDANMSLCETSTVLLCQLVTVLSFHHVDDKMTIILTPTRPTNLTRNLGLIPTA
jgi:hypothetical protein